jgi:hypothetical protein
VTDTLSKPERRAGLSTTTRDLLVLVGIGVVLRLPAVLAPRHLTFDDGNFGMSAIAMRHGGVPFRDVFSSQGPLFLPLVWLADVIGLRTLNAPRLLSLAAGVALIIIVYRAALEISNRTSARVAAALVVATGSSLAVTGPLAADGPAMALGAGAVYLALLYRRRPSTARALAIGVVLGGAIMVKALVLPAAIPVGLILLAGRRPLDWVISVAGAVSMGLFWSLLWGWSDVWDQSVTYHLDAPGGSDPVDNLIKVVNVLITRDTVLLAGLGVALFAAWRSDRLGENRQIKLLLWTWLAAMFALLVIEHPLWRPHVSELVAPGVLLVAAYRPPWKPVVVLCALLLPLHLGYAHELLWPGDYSGDEAEVVERIRDLPEGAQAISDEAGQVWRAGRTTPPDMVDSSILRIDSGRITTDSLTAEASRPEVCMVVVWAEGPERFGHLEGLAESLAEEGYQPVLRFEEPRVVYERTDCSA